MEYPDRDSRDRPSRIRPKFSIVAGAFLGIAGWFLWAFVLSSVPRPIRFVVTLAVFVLGPGSAVVALLARDADVIERWVVALGAGLVVSAALAQLLGAVDLEPAYPALVAALGGMALVSLLFPKHPTATRAGRGDVALCVLAALLALGGGAIAYAHRLSETQGGLAFFGDYDTYDSSYYAAISAELTHQIPPDSPFRAGHRLGYAYHPQLLLAMVHRFGDVPLFDVYFRYGWPAYLVIMSLTMFMTVRRISSPGVAALGVVLVLFGSDFSYVAAEFRPPHADWDRIIWSSNWLTPGAEQLFFNTWTPALAVLFLGFWMLDRYEAQNSLRWLVATAACFASFVQFKPFGFAAVIAGLVGAAVFGRTERAARRRLWLVAGVSVILVLPYIYLISARYEESQAILRPGIAYISVLPNKVITQIGLQRPIAQLSSLFGGGVLATTVVSVVVTNLLFLIGGLGARLVGLPAVWHVLNGKDARSVWLVMAWTIVAGACFPLVVISEPYHQSFHTFHTSLLLLWIFVAFQVFGWSRGSHWQRALIIAAIVLAAVPSTVHYLRLKWTDLEFGFINHDSLVVADRLRQEDFDQTVFLQRYPEGPSFVSVLAERRTVLAWSQYARGSAPVAEEIDRFFESAQRNAADAWSTLERHHVTHVVETVGLDRIHPEVLCRFRLLLETPTLRLHAVQGGASSHECNQKGVEGSGALPTK